jgi:uncharacterized protein (TIGR03435 family)
LSKSLVLVCVAISGVVTLFAQDGGRPGPAFDVASVKRYQPVQGRRPPNVIDLLPGGRVIAPYATLRNLIATAYNILDLQIVDSRNLIPDERFEIEGRTRADATVDDARAMLRTLLAERFGLVAHRESRDLAVQVLTMARADRRPGDKLRPSGSDCAPIQGPPNVSAPPPPPPPPPGDSVARGLPLSGASIRCVSARMTTTYGDHWSYREVPMPILVQRFVEMVGRPVIDRTGLTGSFDVDLTYTSESSIVDAANAPNAPSFTTAIREQLGLRLDPDRAPVEVLVIDAVTPPNEN